MTGVDLGCRADLEFIMRTLRRLANAAICVSAALAVSACGRGNPESGKEQGAFPVQVANPVEREVALTETYTGRFVAVEEVELRARVSGYIKSVHFEEGQKVKKGDLMFQIDPRPFDAEVKAAEARVKQAEARVQLAESNLKRVQTLVESGGVSKEEADIRASEFEQAKADKLAADADLEMAELDREFADVKAPINGIAGKFEVTPGNFISGGTPSADLLATIVPHDPIHCYFEVDERRVLEFTRRFFEGDAPGREGERPIVEIAVSDNEEFEFSGPIDFSENQLDESTATMQLRALVENDSEFLTPGLFARVRVPMGKPFNAILVRDSALGFDQSKRFAWVLQSDNTVQRKYVEVGSLEGSMRVIEGGLTSGDSIVVSGIQLLRDGMAVAPTQTSMVEDTPEAGPKQETETDKPSAEGNEATDDA